MNPPKPNRRKSGANKLEPIDWHEFANDAVLNGNMSTLFHRPPTEDPSAYASPEALVEIEKRARVGYALACPPIGNADPPVEQTLADPPVEQALACPPVPEPDPPVEQTLAGPPPVEAGSPAPGADRPPDQSASAHQAVQQGWIGKLKQQEGKKAKPIRGIHDALTLAGQILYKAMYGSPDGTAARQCAKGYRQLAAETHLDKDTVRDLIADFKDKGILREIASYNPDTRSSKTYEVLSNQAILELWRNAGLFFVTSGRQRPEFCTAQGQPHSPIDTHSGSAGPRIGGLP
jgi:hypothetical protein